jgi:transcriptional regulator with XRE-family HTH domain
VPANASISTKFGRNLVRLREAAGKTQELLAEEAGASPRYLQQLESGREANPSLEVLARLKAALNCSWEELLKGIP